MKQKSLSTEAKLKLELHEKLTSCCMNLLNITFLNDGSVLFNGELFEYYDYETISLNEDIVYDNDFIDFILFFGDGTIEFHLKNEQDAYNWSEFDNNIIIKVLKQLLNLCQETQ